LEESTSLKCIDSSFANADGDSLPFTGTDGAVEWALEAAAAVGVFGVPAIAYRRRVSKLTAELARVRRQADAVLDGIRAVTEASRDSASSVFDSLDRAMRALEPSVEDVLVYVPDGEELACEHASGSRSEHFRGSRIRRDDAVALVARAAAVGCRSGLTNRFAEAAIPTDRTALAIPMTDAQGVRAVVYLGSPASARFDEDALVRTVTQAVTSYALAVDRERDRANATYDALTGLYTPRAFRTALQEELSPAAGSRTTVSLWFVDTDHFKRVNDSYGHAAGDAVLAQMAALLRAHAVPGVDTVARNGGDEFCAVIRNTQKTAAVERAQRFCEAVRAASFGVDVPVSASVGVATFPYDAASANELLEVADAAMYHSKRAGRNCVSFAVNGDSFALYG
jgi:diguanylate cyclase (GGDEF)-like protein